MLSAAVVWVTAPLPLRERCPLEVQQIFLEAARAAQGQDVLLNPFLTALEICGGCSSWSRAWEAKGFATVSFDIGHTTQCDLKSPFVLVLAIACALHLIKNGVAMFAVPCSTLGNVAKGTFKRSRANVLGNAAADSHAQLARSAFVIVTFVERREAIPVFANPLRSLLMALRDKGMLSHVYEPVLVYLRAFQAPFKQPLRIWMPSYIRAWASQLAIRVVAGSVDLPMTKVQETSAGRRWWRGDVHMKCSQMYPPAFSAHFVDLFSAHLGCPVGEPAWPSVVPTTLCPRHIVLGKELVQVLQLYALLCPAMATYSRSIGVPERSLRQLVADGCVPAAYGRELRILLKAVAAATRFALKRPAAAKGNALWEVPLSAMSGPQRAALKQRGRKNKRPGPKWS